MRLGLLLSTNDSERAWNALGKHRFGGGSR